MNHALLLCAILLFTLPATTSFSLEKQSEKKSAKQPETTADIDTIQAQIMSDLKTSASTKKSDDSKASGASTKKSDDSELSGAPDTQAIQSKIMSDPALMNDVINMANDPDIMAVISDPAFIEAVQSRNTAALENDPRMKTLMDNPKIRALVEKISAEHE